MWRMSDSECLVRAALCAWNCSAVWTFTDRPRLLSTLQRSPADTSLRRYSWPCSSDLPMNTTTLRQKNTGMHVKQRLARPSPLLQSFMNSQKCRLLENLLFQTGGETESTTALLIRIQLRVASKTGPSQQLAWLTGAAHRLLWKSKKWFPLMLKSHLWPTTKTRPCKGDSPNVIRSRSFRSNQAALEASKVSSCCTCRYWSCKAANSCSNFY